jgi:hypothetical protein
MPGLLATMDPFFGMFPDDGLLALYDTSVSPDLGNVVYDFSKLPIPDCA